MTKTNGQNTDLPPQSEVANLIERLEAETGQRIDSNSGDSNAMAGLFGAVLREMGQSQPWHKPQDDVMVGTVIRHQMTPEYKQKQESDKMLADMLTGGMSPDDIGKFFG